MRADNPRQTNRRPAKRSPHSREARSKAFRSTMAATRRHMPKQQRVFSKIIHIKAIDRVSTLIGLSVARPNALLLGALGSFTVAFTVYTLSKSHGYAISGLEPIIGFTAGWLAGTLYDTIKPLVTKIAAVLR